MSKVVKGVTGAVVFYILIFFIAYAFQDAPLIVPVELLVVLLIYGILGCIFMVFVLPVAVIIGEIRKRKETNHSDPSGQEKDN